MIQDISRLCITYKPGLAVEATACAVQPDLEWPGHMTRSERALTRDFLDAVSMIPNFEGRLVPENAAYSQRQRLTGSVIGRTTRSLRTLARGRIRVSSKFSDFQSRSSPETAAICTAQMFSDYPTNQYPDRATIF